MREKLFIGFVLGAVVVAFVWYFIPREKAGQSFGSVASSISIGAATSTNTSSFWVTSSKRIMATSSLPTDPGNQYTRIYATICNPSATVVHINLGADAPATFSTSTAVIAAAAGYDACYEITEKNLYQGSVTASSTGVQTRVIVSEFVQ